MTGRTPYREAYLSPRRIEQPATIPQGEIQLTICMPLDRYLLFWEALTRGGEELGYGSIGDHNIDAIVALATMRACGDEPTTPTVIEDMRQRAMTIVYNGADEEEELASFPYYQKVDGIWHLGFPCEGCGGVEWVPLNSGGMLGGGGGTSGRNPAIPYLPTGSSLSGTGGASCYANKAVPYFAEQCGEFWEWMVDASITAIEYADLLTPVTEGFDATAAIADAISGSGTTRELITLGVDVLKTVIAAPGNIDALKARWTFTGIPNYGEVKAWIDGTTFVNEPAIAKKAWQTWALRLIVPKHYGALNTMIVECATDKDLGSIAASSVVFDNQQFRVTELAGFPRTLSAVNGVQTPLQLPNIGDVNALVIFHPVPAQVGFARFTVPGSNTFFDYNNGGGTGASIITYGGSVNWQSIANLAGAEAYVPIGEQAYNGASNGQGTFPSGGGLEYTHVNGGTLNIPIARMWLMQEL